MKVRTGVPEHQTFWELLALGLALCTWGDSFTRTSVALLNDNTAALQAALQLKGKGPMLQVAREIAWRKAKRGWSYEVGHVPTEQNGLADALSRQCGPSPQPLPEALKRVERCEGTAVAGFWKLRD